MRKYPFKPQQSKDKFKQSMNPEEHSDFMSHECDVADLLFFVFVLIPDITLTSPAHTLLMLLTSLARLKQAESDSDSQCLSYHLSLFKYSQVPHVFTYECKWEHLYVTALQYNAWKKSNSPSWEHLKWVLLQSWLISLDGTPHPVSFLLSSAVHGVPSLLPGSHLFPCLNNVL